MRSLQTKADLEKSPQKTRQEQQLPRRRAGRQDDVSGGGNKPIGLWKKKKRVAADEGGGSRVGLARGDRDPARVLSRSIRLGRKSVRVEKGKGK